MEILDTVLSPMTMTNITENHLETHNDKIEVFSMPRGGPLRENAPPSEILDSEHRYLELPRANQTYKKAASAALFCLLLGFSNGNRIWLIWIGSKANRFEIYVLEANKVWVIFWPFTTLKQKTASSDCHHGRWPKIRPLVTLKASKQIFSLR